ncbi:MAG TPA: glucoamylase family protein [Gemmatimonadales bacterium]|nr:glucoamylase family protein [Gemmatimonadales bacterium]
MADPGIDAIAVLQERTVGYFTREVDSETGLVKDSTRPESPASIAATGLACACYAVCAERGILPRAEAAGRVGRTLRFLWEAEQSEAADASGARGFFYHFLDARTGRRAWRSELSTVDSAICFAGALAAAGYFDGPSEEERAIRELADALYRRAEWRWMVPRQAIAHGWTPEQGFLPFDWIGYNEALFVYVLALGSPTFPPDESVYDAWTAGYQWRSLLGHEYLYAGPLFMHQLSQIWIDFRGIQDEYMRAKQIDYFENSRRATLVQCEYARRNPRRFAGYSAESFGISASDGPGPFAGKLRRGSRTFYGYRGRGVPFGPDDGTLAPWALVASLPFAPELVVPAMRHFDRVYPELTGRYGYESSFNPSFGGKSPAGWVCDWHYAIDQGPVVLMVENYLSSLTWRALRESPYIREGLRRAGFRGGWLGSEAGGGGGSA